MPTKASTINLTGHPVEAKVIKCPMGFKFTVYLLPASVAAFAVVGVSKVDLWVRDEVDCHGQVPQDL